MPEQDDLKQILFLAAQQWVLRGLGISEQLAEIKKNMAEFSAYKAAVNATLDRVLQLSKEETEQILAALEAVKTNDAAAIELALTELAAKKQQVIDAVSGIISTVPSPTVPTPIPPIVDGELPPVTIPTVPPEVPTSGLDPIVPVTIEPSPFGVGVDGGFSISE